MKYTKFAIALLFSPALAWSACPEYLDQTMRKLHSQESVNLCAVQDGKPMLIVNTASHCGFTSQFEGLESLHKKYAEQGLVVVGFASDDFRQEADTEEEAADICYVNYGVTFTMLAPSGVRGDDANPVFRELAAQSDAPSWNFNKYVVGRDGAVVAHFGSRTTPDDEALLQAVEEAL